MSRTARADAAPASGGARALSAGLGQLHGVCSACHAHAAMSFQHPAPCLRLRSSSVKQVIPCAALLAQHALGQERACCPCLQGNNTLSSVSAHRNVDGTYSGTMALRNGGPPAHCHARPATQLSHCCMLLAPQGWCRPGGVALHCLFCACVHRAGVSDLLARHWRSQFYSHGSLLVVHPESAVHVSSWKRACAEFNKLRSAADYERLIAEQVPGVPMEWRRPIGEQCMEAPVSSTGKRCAARTSLPRDCAVTCGLGPWHAARFLSCDNCLWRSRVRCSQLHGNRVVLLGDAAHAVTPVGGQGANAALQDCEVLDRVLAECGVPAPSSCKVSVQQREIY